MGLKEFFFGKEKEKTAVEKQIEENKEQYAQAQVENIPTCNGCGQDIEGTPRLHKHQGKLMYFHKRCFKAMKRGQLPKPKLVDDTKKEEVTKEVKEQKQ